MQSIKQQKKTLEENMRQRAFDLRVLTGRGQSRDDLMKDPIWKKLNDQFEKLC